MSEGKVPDDDDHEVGYGKPPKQTRFVKGTSGNPAGRPRKPRHAPTDNPFDRVLDETCGTAQVQGKTKSINGREAIYRALAMAAAKGDLKAAWEILKEEVQLMRARARALRSQLGTSECPVMVVPETPSIEEFEAVAVPAQEKLVREVRM